MVSQYHQGLYERDGFEAGHLRSYTRGVVICGSWDENEKEIMELCERVVRINEADYYTYGMQIVKEGETVTVGRKDYAEIWLITAGFRAHRYVEFVDEWGNADSSTGFERRCWVISAEK